jgi:drug/metabolite transporter (DMT)-like permease
MPDRPSEAAAKPAPLPPLPQQLRLWASRLEPYSLLIALGLIVIWGCNFNLQKYVFKAVSPNGVLLVRYAVVMPLCSLGLLFFLYGRAWPQLTRTDAWTLFKLGCIGHWVHVSLVTHGMNWSTPFSSSVLIACGPIFTLMLLRFMAHERLHGGALAGVLIAMTGVLLFMSEKLVSGSWTAGAGDLALLFAASCFSYYTVAARPLIARLGGVPVMAYATLLSCPPIVVMASLGGGWDVAWLQVPLLTWLSLLYGIVIAAFGGWVVWGWVNGVRGVARSAPLGYLMVPVAGIVSWLSGGEHFTPAKVLGAIIALAGVAYAQFAAHDPRVESPAGE